VVEANLKVKCDPQRWTRILLRAKNTIGSLSAVTLGVMADAGLIRSEGTLKSNISTNKVAVTLAITLLCSTSSLTPAFSDDTVVETVMALGNSKNPREFAISRLEGYASTLLNEGAVNFLQTGPTSPWKHLSFSLAIDGGKPNVDFMGVYGIHEEKNYFLFNQTSIVQYDDRTTLNFGLGLRHINDQETVIIGGNIFHDHEFDSGHNRLGVGLEALTSVAQFRANYYKALTDQISFDGGQEEALDGYDAKFTYELPFFYSSNVFAKYTKWTDGAGYTTSSGEIGLGAEIAPNLTVNLAGSSSDDAPDNFSARVTYAIALGGTSSVPAIRDGHARTTLQPIRYMLYQPVQRENRIMKKTTRLGVTASGY
jgi:hypothetical protein